MYGGLTLPDYTAALDGASCSNIGVNTKMLGWLTKRTIMNSARNAANEILEFGKFF